MTNSVGCNETLFHNSQAMARKMVSRSANLHGRRRNRFFMQRERPPSHYYMLLLDFMNFQKGRVLVVTRVHVFGLFLRQLCCRCYSSIIIKYAGSIHSFINRSTYGYLWFYIYAYLSMVIYGYISMAIYLCLSIYAYLSMPI